MSIVISVIEKNRKFYIASDKRGERNGVRNDHYKKIYLLSPKCYFGMTGIYECGLEIFSILNKCSDKRIENLKQLVSDIFNSYTQESRPEKMTITLAGKNDDGCFFIWQRNIQGEGNCINGSENIECAVSAGDRIKEFTKFLEDTIKSGQNTKDSIIATIKYASQIDPSISEEYDLYKII